MRSRMKSKILLVLCLFILTTTGLPNGAPVKTCPTLTPLHPGVSEQNSPPPYQVRPVAGQRRVLLTLGSPQGLPYEGFMLLARDVDSGEYVGSFANLPESTKTVECIEGVQNAVTHANTEKKHNIEFDWEAPEDYVGAIIFNSTFAQDYSTYWVGVESPMVTVLKRSIEVKTVPTTPPPLRTTTPPLYNVPVDNVAANVDDPFYNGCGTEKNCFGAPDGCIERKNCEAAVAVRVRGESYIFELQARDRKWVAVGLSDDSKMGRDSVVECVDTGSSVELYMSWNPARSNMRIPTPKGAVEKETGAVKDGMISCKFRREKNTVVQGIEYDLVNTPYHLLVASGRDLKSKGVGYHDIAAASAESKLLSDVGGLAAASDILVRVHGALMLASWIGTASVGILLARYYKQTWVNSSLCGNDHWFAWHRLFMILTWAMTMAGFVVIFVELEEWSSATVHASLGLATTILCFIQPFMAALRPHPGTPRRNLFNWAHWFVGNAAHICGIIAIFFAVRLNKAKLPDWVDWMLVAFVVFHILTHLVLTFAGCASDRQASLRVNSFPMKDMHARTVMSHPDARRDAPHSGLRKLIFGIYFIIIAAFAIALIVITVLPPIEETWATLRNTIMSN